MSKETKNETEQLEEIDKMVNKKCLIYKAGSYTYSFQQFETIRSFAKIFLITKVI